MARFRMHSLHLARICMIILIINCDHGQTKKTTFSWTGEQWHRDVREILGRLGRAAVKHIKSPVCISPSSWTSQKTLIIIMLFSCAISSECFDDMSGRFAKKVSKITNDRSDDQLVFSLRTATTSYHPDQMGWQLVSRLSGPIHNRHDLPRLK